MYRMKTSQIAAVIALALILGLAWGIARTVAGGSEDPYAAVGRGIDVFGRVYVKLAREYVREIDPEELMNNGIEGMLNGLDPYTHLFTKKAALDQLKIDTTGKFGGLGITIAIKDKYPTVISPIEGTPAYDVGLQAGDRIVKIEGELTKGKDIDEVVSVLRGEPNTKVTITVEREGLQDPIDFEITRAEINVKSVTLAKELQDGIAYVRLAKFSANVEQELDEALARLKEKQLRALVLDVRSNPGGLLEQAYIVADKFLDKGRLIVSTKGRLPSQTKEYVSPNDPAIDRDIPLIVLVNGASASASEILAGAIQDWDRGLVLGTRTFGKGSVQTVADIYRSRGEEDENVALKMTTAYYYTPSGRCIHDIENGAYSVALGEAEQDSAAPRQLFKTRLKGRVVYGGGGIVPDVEVEPLEMTQFAAELQRRRMFFSFAVHYGAARSTLPPDFQVDDAVISQFQVFIADSLRHFDYESPAERQVEELDMLVEKHQYGDRVRQELDQLKAALAEEKARDFDRSRDYIRMALRRELASRFWGSEATIEATFPEDRQLHAAIDILNNPKVYEQHMSAQVIAAGEQETRSD